MKKFLILLLSVIFAFSAVSLVGCKDDEPEQTDGATLSLYCPDGAPALSVARLLNDTQAAQGVDVNVVTANTITAYVTGESPQADAAILPVNAATKLLGSGSVYQIYGVVTHGNLFIMKKASGVNITADNLNVLIGKKVGVINLANVPGLTFKAILSDHQIPFANLGESGEVDPNKVNLVGLADGTLVTPAADCDYFIVPEPAATTKQNATHGALSIAGSLQQLYGEGQGYPQAVLVVKKSLAQSHSSVINTLVNSFAQNKTWLTTASATDVVNAVMSGFVDSNTAPTFSANNLNATVINNCAINYVDISNCKQEVLDYMAKINAVSNNAWGTPSDAFFHIPS